MLRSALKFGIVALAAATVMLVQPARATITTLTLDLSSLPVGAFSGALSVDGFVLTPALGQSSIPQIVNSAGVYNLQSTSSVGAGGADTWLTRVGGGVFSMVSVQLAALGGDRGSYGIAISNGAAGFVVGSRYGSPVSSTFTTYDLTGVTALSGQAAIDLDPVSDNGNNFAIAAITVSFDNAVPEPATLGLFAVGIGMVGMIRRRKRV